VVLCGGWEIMAAIDGMLFLTIYQIIFFLKREVRQKVGNMIMASDRLKWTNGFKWTNELQARPEVISCDIL
jgi:hypothetical protein